MSCYSEIFSSLRRINSFQTRLSKVKLHPCSDLDLVLDGLAILDSANALLADILHRICPNSPWNFSMQLRYWVSTMVVGSQLSRISSSHHNQAWWKVFIQFISSTAAPMHSNINSPWSLNLAKRVWGWAQQKGSWMQKDRLVLGRILCEKDQYARKCSTSPVNN